MGVPAKLTERQIKFAELLVYNEGRLSPAEAAFQAGYKTRPRQAASELRNNGLRVWQKFNNVFNQSHGLMLLIILALLILSLQA